mmetsp:Transcript_8245/g.16963  ORF Transcript_8245/g.16963 Transcript_8245/m.16963 type:complete len:97 (+) Transcript_8245:86-376(+)
MKILIELCPDSPKARDCMNRTPLHVAAGTGANVMIVELLIQAYPEACQIQDVDGRSPLIWLAIHHAHCSKEATSSKEKRLHLKSLVPSLLRRWALQ